MKLYKIMLIGILPGVRDFSYQLRSGEVEMFSWSKVVWEKIL